MEGLLNVAHLRRATIVCATEASVWVLDRGMAERSGEIPWRYHGDTMGVADFNPYDPRSPVQVHRDACQ